jgi:osmotically-inducible protein OsmY
MTAAWRAPHRRGTTTSRWGPVASAVLTGTWLALGAAASGCTPTAPATPAKNAESAGELLDDTVITTKVKAALLAEPSLKSFQIGVTTFKDTVQLSGFVDSAGTKELAGKLTLGVKGVAILSNNLIVK